MWIRAAMSVDTYVGRLLVWAAHVFAVRQRIDWVVERVEREPPFVNVVFQIVSTIAPSRDGETSKHIVLAAVHMKLAFGNHFGNCFARVHFEVPATFTNRVYLGFVVFDRCTAVPITAAEDLCVLHGLIVCVRVFLYFENVTPLKSL